MGKEIQYLSSRPTHRIEEISRRYKMPINRVLISNDEIVLTKKHCNLIKTNS